MSASAHPESAFAMLPIARSFVQAGHQVTFLAEEQHAERLAAIGAEHEVVRGGARTPPPDDRSIFPGIQQLGALVRTEMLDPLAGQWRAVESVRARRRVDVILTDPQFLGAFLLALQPRSMRPPVIALGSFPLTIVDAGVAPFGFGLPPVDGAVNRLRNVVLQTAVDQVLLRRINRELREVARRLTGQHLTTRLQDTPLNADVWAQLTVPRFEYPRVGLPDHVRFVGPIPPDDIGELPDWWFARDARPIVHICHVPGTDPFGLVVPAVRALALEDVLVVVTTGDDDGAVLAALGRELPENVRVEAYLPFSHLLAEARVMVAVPHYALVQWALRWGVPIVTAGIAVDQIEVGARIGWAGAGVVLPGRHPTPEQFSAAVRHVLADPSARTAAARIAAQIARTDPLKELLTMSEDLAGTGTGEAVRAS